MNDANKQLALDILSKFDFAGDIGQILGFIGQLRDLVDAFFQALGGNFGPLQDWVSDLVGGTVSGFEWLSDLTSFQPLTNLFATIEGIVEAITGSVGSLEDLNSWFQTAFGDLWDVIGNIVNQILSALGITGSGSILDRIMDLADEFGHMLDNLEDAASGLTNLSDFVQDIIDTLTGGVGGGLSELADWAEGLIAGAVADFEDLMKAFQGNYSGTDSFLNTIQGIVSGLRGGLTGLIGLWRIPQVSLSQLTNQPSANLLTGFGDFADSSTIAPGTDWSWDGTVGATSMGSARAEGDGTLKILTSELVASAESQQLTISGKVRWQSIAGSGTLMRLILVPYVGSAQQPNVVISTITNPGANSSGFVALSGSYTVPAGVTGVRVQITAESAMTSGTVWWDDVTLTKVATSLPQTWVSGLVDALGNLGDWITHLVDQLITSLGLTSAGSLFDRIANLASGFSGWFDDSQDQASAIADLQDVTQTLEGVVGYASRYMSTGAGVQTSPTTLNFDVKKGPSEGVTLLSGGRFRLDSKGLWRFEAQVKFNDSKWSPPRCYMDIVIRDPSGVEVGRLEAMNTSDAPLTITNVMPYVIPTAGYTVEVQAWTSSLPLIGAAWRTIGSGLQQTNFSVFKISSETS